MNLIEAFEFLPKGSIDGKTIPICLKKSWNFTKMICYLPRSNIFSICKLEKDEFQNSFSKVPGSEHKLTWQDFSTEDLTSDDYEVSSTSAEILVRFDKKRWWDGK